VRLPKELQLTSEQVEIFRQGNNIVLRERSASATAIFDAFVGMPAEFMAEVRSDNAPQERDSF
jgi:antitoxin VapB